MGCVCMHVCAHMYVYISLKENCSKFLRKQTIPLERMPLAGLGEGSGVKCCGTNLMTRVSSRHNGVGDRSVAPAG